MKSTLIVLAIALASGLLVASGAVAQQVGSNRQIDVLGPEYNDLDLRSASSGGQAESEMFLGEAGASATSHRQIDVLGPEYNDLDLRSEGSAEQAETGEMVPAGSSEGVDIMGPDYRGGFIP
jgi:hypothetical protein